MDENNGSKAVSVLTGQSLKIGKINDKVSDSNKTPSVGRSLDRSMAKVEKSIDSRESSDSLGRSKESISASSAKQKK